jgi:hypothetical protein
MHDRSLVHLCHLLSKFYFELLYGVTYSFMWKMNETHGMFDCKVSKMF